MYKLLLLTILLSGCVTTERIGRIECMNYTTTRTRTIHFGGLTDVSQVPVKIRRCLYRNLDTGCTAIYSGEVDFGNDEEVTLQRSTDWKCSS